jgi:hypothetical protein
LISKDAKSSSAIKPALILSIFLSFSASSSFYLFSIACALSLFAFSMSFFVRGFTPFFS